MNTNSSDGRVFHVDTDWLRGEEDLCAYLRIKCKKTLREHVTSKLLPSGIVGNIVYYHKKDVDKFLRTNDPNLVTAHKHAAKREFVTRENKITIADLM